MRKYRFSFTHPMWPTETFYVKALDYKDALTVFKNNLLEDAGVDSRILKEGKITLLSKGDI